MMLFVEKFKCVVEAIQKLFMLGFVISLMVVLMNITWFAMRVLDIAFGDSRVNLKEIGIGAVGRLITAVLKARKH